jgi:hypothetical protein
MARSCLHVLVCLQETHVQINSKGPAAQAAPVCSAASSAPQIWWHRKGAWSLPDRLVAQRSNHFSPTCMG